MNDQDKDDMRRKFMMLAGTLLYGATSWQVPLARDLHVSERSMRRWKAGKNPVPADIEEKLCTLCKERSYRLLQLIGEAK